MPKRTRTARIELRRQIGRLKLKGLSDREVERQLGLYQGAVRDYTTDIPRESKKTVLRLTSGGVTVVDRRRPTTTVTHTPDDPDVLPFPAARP